MKYEDLASDPEAELRRLCAFVGLEFEPTMLDVRHRVQHVTSGNDMRLRRDTRIRMDSAWQKGLKPADARFFDASAGAVNRRLGYE